MADLVVIVPSRGRPQAARELAQAFVETCTADTRLVFAVDDDDPDLPGYREVLSEYRTAPIAVEVCIANNDDHTMVCALNKVALALVNIYRPAPYALGFLGDDHRPRTRGWDQRYLDVLRELGTGIVYGNDLLQGDRLPTQAAMTADIVAALGYMAPPGLRHMYVDNFWRDVGQAAGCLRYLPDVIVEHLHPVAGKAAVDEGYARVNAPAVYAADEAAYTVYRSTRLAADAAVVAGLAGRHQHEWRLFEPNTTPECTTPEWYADREHAPHLEDGHRPRLQAAASLVAQAAITLDAATVVDLGAGDGGLLSLLGPALTAWGYDLQPTNIAAAAGRGVDVRYGDVLADDVEWGQIAVCTEMLEHLVDPHGLVRRIGERAQALVCSSPRDERPGAAYEHHCWAWDMPGYRAMVEAGGWSVIRHMPVGRFQVLLAVRS